MNCEAHLEPDSVILRDPKTGVKLSILEQNYRADPVTEGLLLSLNEGKEIEFFVKEPNKPDRTVKGRVIRSGYVPKPPRSKSSAQHHGVFFYSNQAGYVQGSAGIEQPIIEVDGKLQFNLPGQPVFPVLADDTILKPTLDWRIHSKKAAKLDAELCYVTGGMSWESCYNLVSPETGDVLDVTGWVTMDNQSGKTFREAKIQLMAGDVSKLQPENNVGVSVSYESDYVFSGTPAPKVTEKSFDEYHLYDLPLPTTLHDQETKQVEFVRASGVQSQRIYVYDGVKIDLNRYRNWNMDTIRNDRDYGTRSNSKVWVMREFKNSEANHLGIPLPRGRVRFYRQETDSRLQFVGEDLIDHTPKDELLRVTTGNAFDLVGERRRTNYRDDVKWLDESFEIKLRNHKKEPVEIRVVEHLYRWTNWEIREPSTNFTKTDAQTIEFRVPLKPDQEGVVTYTVHYSW